MALSYLVVTLKIIQCLCKYSIIRMTKMNLEKKIWMTCTAGLYILVNNYNNKQNIESNIGHRSILVRFGT